MGSSLSTLRTIVGDLLQDSSFTHYGGDSTQANRAINQAIKHVSTNTPWKYLNELRGYDNATSIVSGTASYDISSLSIMELRAVYYCGDGSTWGYCDILDITDIPVLEKNPWYNGTMAHPKVYHDYDEYLTFDPTPTADTANAVRLYYVEVAGTLSSDSDTCQLNTIMDYPVAYYACAILASADKEEEKWMNMYNFSMQQIIGGKSE